MLPMLFDLIQPRGCYIPIKVVVVCSLGETTSH